MEYSTLARAFFQAGAPSVAATLWPVSDQATLSLVELFYKNVLSGSNYSESLARAQSEMVRKKYQYSKPEFWAGFILFGKP